MAQAWLKYPFVDEKQKLPRLGLKDIKKRYLRTLAWKREPDPDLAHHLRGIELVDQVGPDEVVILTRQKDGMRYIRSFLRHYREIGADRFIIIDEASTDGTPDFLATQEDVITLPAATNFANSRRGRDWLNAVLMRLPKGQRVITPDSDEYLVFSDGAHDLRAMFDAMARRGLQRLCTIMLDCYPPAPIREAVFDGSTDQLPWEVAPYFDTCSYSIENTWQGPLIKGGVRRRLFQEELFLTKYPAIFNPRKAIFGPTVHFTQPLTQNTMPVGGILLHFKYFSDFVEEHKKVVERGVHNKGGKTYQAVLDQLEGVDVAEEFNFIGDGSVRYTGPAQLCALGLMHDICRDTP